MVFHKCPQQANVYLKLFQRLAKPDYTIDILQLDQIISHAFIPLIKPLQAFRQLLNLCNILKFHLVLNLVFGHERLFYRLVFSFYLLLDIFGQGVPDSRQAGVDTDDLLMILSEDFLMQEILDVDVWSEEVVEDRVKN